MSPSENQSIPSWPLTVDDLRNNIEHLRGHLETKNDEISLWEGREDLPRVQAMIEERAGLSDLIGRLEKALRASHMNALECDCECDSDGHAAACVPCFACEVEAAVKGHAPKADE